MTAVSDIDALYDVVEAFVRVPARPAGRRVGILTNSGGLGVLAADAAHDAGLALARLSPETEARLAADLPVFASPRNPVDVTLQQISDPDAVERHIRTLAADPAVDVLLACFGVVRRHVETTIACMACAAADIEVPLITGWHGGDPAGPDKLRAEGLTAYPSPGPALRAIRALFDHAAWRPAAQGTAPPPDMRRAAALLDSRRSDAPTVLAAAGIPVTRSLLAVDAEAALRAAREIGWPVVLKLESPDLPHRSDVGGVAPGLTNGAALRAAYDAMMAFVAQARPDVWIAGVSVHENAAGIAELIVGVKQDETFGPLVILGFGGTLVELLRDSAVALPPVPPEATRAMLETLRGYPALTGARGRPKADLDAVAEVVWRAGALAGAAPALQELDINPLIVRAEGEDAVAADALITLGPVSRRMPP